MFDKELFLSLNDNEQYIVACEALLRRISFVNLPFALKGSLLSRQYMPNHVERTIEDMDFFYMEKIEEMHEADNIFTNWMRRSTTMDLGDGFEFEDFKKHAYWDSINYAMDEDFPTVNTDIDYTIPSIYNDDDDFQVDLDVSFNLDINFEFIPLTYKPIMGEEFVVSYTVPLFAQIAWKLHQTIIRPRFKDLYDLKYLISHPSYNSSQATETLIALANECSYDKTIKDEQKSINFAENAEHIRKDITKDYFWSGSKWQRVPEDMALQVIKDLVDVMQNAELTDKNFKQYL